MKFVAELNFRGDDAECERLYNNYKKAKGELVGYLTGEGIDSRLELERRKVENEAASGD